jgi:hypothetical protein
MNSIGKVVKMDGQCTKQQKFLEYLERWLQVTATLEKLLSVKAARP